MTNRQFEDDPLVFSAGDVLRLLDKFFPHGERPVAVRDFVTRLEHARQARDEVVVAGDPREWALTRFEIPER